MPGDGQGDPWKRFAAQQLPKPAKASATASAFARSVLRKDQLRRPAPTGADAAPPPQAAESATAATKIHERPSDTYTVASGRQTAATLALYRGNVPAPAQAAASGAGQEAADQQQQPHKAVAYRKRPSLLGLFGGAAPASGGAAVAAAVASPSSDSSSPVGSGHKARKGSGGRWQPIFSSTPSQSPPDAGTGSEAATPEDDRMHARTPRGAPEPPRTVLRMCQEQDESCHAVRMRQDQDDSYHAVRMRPEQESSCAPTGAGGSYSNNNNNNNSGSTQRPRYFERLAGYTFSIPAEPSPLTKYEARHSSADTEDSKQPPRDAQPVRAPTPVPAVEDRVEMEVDNEEDDNSVDLSSSEQAEEPSSSGPPNRQGSLELDESLGILTPDQMKEPFSLLGAAGDAAAFFCGSTPAGAGGVGGAPWGGGGESSVLRMNALCREVVYVDQFSFPEYDSIMDTVEESTAGGRARASASPLPASPCSGGASASGAGDGDATEHTLSPEELPVDTPVREDADEDTRTDDASDNTLLTASSSAEPSSRSSVAVPPPPPPAAAPQQGVALAAPAAGAGPAPHCFITSVTSITSLDTGYQGDGESSRPASRGAELSSPPGPAPKAAAAAAASHALDQPQQQQQQQDPMTDSDFFTESDADGHEEARAPPPAAAPAAHEELPSSSSSSAAAGCGDRRAQVIDGTLYNESQRLQQRCPSFTASSEMESSGVFSDLEPRRPEDGDADADADADDASAAHDADASPTASTGSASEHSQEKEAQSPTGSNVTASTTVILEDAALEEAERALTEENNLKNLSSPVITELAAPSPAQGEPSPQEQPKAPGAGGTKTPAAGAGAGDAKPRELKKFKMPKRNVVSKIKAMIEAPTPHEDQENQRPLHKPKKGGRWDAVMNKIAQGQAEQRVLKTHLKEVKSKVFAGLAAPPAPDSTTGRRKAGTPTSSAVAALERTGSADSTTPTRTKSRRTRTRASPVSQTQHLPLSGHSSVRSSVSDVSGEHASAATPSCKSVSSLRSAKKRADTTRANSPLSDGSLNSSASHQPARRQSQQKNGLPDMKTPVARKPASRRSAPVTTPAKPQPLRDHNRVAGSGAPLKEPAGKLQPQLQTAPAVPTRAQLQQLRHSATGFEAFAVLVQYLVNDTEEKRCRYKDEISRLERLHSEREAALLEDGVSKLRQAEAEHKHQLRESEQRAKELRERLEAADAETARLQQQVEDLVSRDREAQLQTEQTRCRYEGEISRLERLHAEREAVLLEDGVARLQQAEAEHKRQLRESEQRAEELRARLEAADAETSHLQQQVAGLVSGLRQDRDAQLQVTAGRCHDLEEEVRSLRTVLDLRHEELAEVRRQNAELAKDAGELPGALQRIATLQARVEDLQEQLQHKADFERQLSQENRKLNESFHHVAVQKQRLSQHNEELQWKLKQSTEAVHVITQALTSTPLSHNNHKTGRKLIDSFHDYSQAFPEISKSYTKLSSRSPLMQRRCDLSNTAVMHHDLEHPSPPASPKVKAIVKKSDSVSWVLDMDESPEAKVSRLVRRAGSFRGSSGLSPPSPAQSQTLPRSRGASGPGSRRSTGTSAGRSRTRAWSVSSSDNFVSCWGSSGTCATSAPVTMQRSVSGTPSPIAHSYGEDNYTVSAGKTPLKRCSGDPDECSVNGDEDDDMRQHHNANGSVAKRSNADSGPSSLDGQLLSLRTCGSSNSSSASPPGSNTCSSTSSCSEGEHNYRHLNGTIIYQQVETDTVDMRVVPVPHLSGSSDLSLLAAACAAAKPLMGAPKDAAGEAMISEETLDNENDGDGGDTSSDGEDPQSWENVGLLPSDSEA